MSKLLQRISFNMLLLTAISLLGIESSFAQQTDSLMVVDIKTCIDVEDREPRGPASVFPDTVGQVYCFSVVEGAKDSTIITHVWYHDQKKRAEVSLNVNPGRWRTWSSKKIMKIWTGSWHVDVLTTEGTVLKSVAFEIAGPQE